MRDQSDLAAIQTHDTLSALAAPLGIGAVCVYGGGAPIRSRAI